MRTRVLILMTALLALGLLTACREAPQSAPARPATGSAVVPAATVPGIWTQIGTQRGRLDAAIRSGKLQSARPLGFGLRDLVEALARKAGTASPVVAPKLDSLAAEVRVSARRLGERADARDARGARVEYARMVALLDAIEAVTNGHTTSE